VATPDQGIKKIIIPKSKLPGFFGENKTYILRYRFISEDKNRTSHWSPAYKIVAEDTPSEILNSMVVDTTNRIVNLAWEPQSNIEEYFIYIKWNNGNWQYYTKTTQTNYSIVYDATKTYINVAVQAKTIPLERFIGSELFENEGSLI
jgi:uncharacterized protein (UPF0248 family)